MPVIAAYEKIGRDLLRINIGNFPAKESIIITLHLTQLLAIEDASWVFRLPVCFTPRYVPLNSMT